MASRSSTSPAFDRLAVFGRDGRARHVVARDVGDVLAVVRGFRPLGVARLEAAGARLRRDGEVADLHARVVVVELAMHRVALRREQVRERVAERRLATVADVQRTGRIRRHEFDEHALARIARRTAVRRAFAEHRRDHVLLCLRRETQVDKAGTGDFRALHEPLCGRMAEHRIDDLLRELTRVRAQRLRKLHRDVRCHVAMRRDLRPFEHDRGRDESGLRCALGGLRDLFDRVGEERFQGFFVCGQHAECDPVERMRSVTRQGRATRSAD